MMHSKSRALALLPLAISAVVSYSGFAAAAKPPQPIVSAKIASYEGYRLAAFYGWDGSLNLAYPVNGAGAWTGFIPLAGSMFGPNNGPIAIGTQSVNSTQQIDVIAVNAAGNPAVFHTTSLTSSPPPPFSTTPYTPPGPINGGWGNLGGSSTIAMQLMGTAVFLVVVYVDTSGRVYAQTVLANNTWETPVQLGTTFPGSGVTIFEQSASQQIDVFYFDSASGKLTANWLTNGNTFWNGPFQPAGVPTVSGARSLASGGQGWQVGSSWSFRSNVFWVDNAGKVEMESTPDTTDMTHWTGPVAVGGAGFDGGAVPTSAALTAGIQENGGTYGQLDVTYINASSRLEVLYTVSPSGNTWSQYEPPTGSFTAPAGSPTSFTYDASPATDVFTSGNGMLFGELAGYSVSPSGQWNAAGPTLVDP